MEGKISPNAFNKNIRPSKRLDDHMATPTLNRLQARQNYNMLHSRPEPVKRDYNKEENITLMNEELTINVIEEEKYRVSSPQLRSSSPQYKHSTAPIAYEQFGVEEKEIS